MLCSVMEIFFITDQKNTVFFHEHNGLGELERV